MEIFLFFWVALCYFLVSYSDGKKMKEERSEYLNELNKLSEEKRKLKEEIIFLKSKIDIQK